MSKESLGRMSTKVGSRGPSLESLLSSLELVATCGQTARGRLGEKDDAGALETRGFQSTSAALVSVLRENQLIHVCSKELKDDATSSKLIRTWVGRLNELIFQTAEESPLLRFLGMLCILTIEQLGPRELEENLALMVSNASRLAYKLTSIRGLSVSMSVVAALVAAKESSLHSRTSLSNEGQITIGKTIASCIETLKPFAKRGFIGNVTVSEGDISCILVSLDSLLSLLVHAPFLMKTYALSVEVICVNLVLSRESSVLEAAGKVLASTVGCHGASLAPIAFTSLMNRLLRSGFVLLNKLYGIKVPDEIDVSNAGENTDSNSGSRYYAHVGEFFESIPSKYGNTDPHLQKTILATVLKAVTTCIQKTLEQGIGFVNYPRCFFEFCLSPLLEFIRVGLGERMQVQQKLRSPAFSVSATAFLSLLRTLIPIARLQLLQKHAVLMSLLEKLLSLHNDCALNISFQREVLLTCRAWICTYRSGTNPTLCHSLVSYACKSMLSLEGLQKECDENEIASSSKNMKARASKKRRITTKASGNVTTSRPPTMAESIETCCDALETVELLLGVNGTLLDESTREEFDSCLLLALEPLLAGVAFGLSSGAFSVSCPKYRKSLLRALLSSSLATVDGESSTFVLPQALRIFRTCQADPEKDIAQFSLLAIGALGSLIHPANSSIGEPRRLIVHDPQGENIRVERIPKTLDPTPSEKSSSESKAEIEHITKSRKSLHEDKLDVANFTAMETECSEPDDQKAVSSAEIANTDSMPLPEIADALLSHGQKEDFSSVGEKAVDSLLSSDTRDNIPMPPCQSDADKFSNDSDSDSDLPSIVDED